MTVNYVIDNRGRPRVSEIRTQPDEFSDMERMVVREIKRRRFRPMVVDGDMTQSEMQTYTHEFRYRQSELEEIRAESAKVEDGE